MPDGTDHPLNLSDIELIARLTQVEDSFVERKSKSDKGGWIKSVVAFANSTPIGMPAVLFIGVSNNGEISGDLDPENTLRMFSDVISSHIWPPVYTVPRALRDRDKACVAVLIPGSPERPHFAGKAFVREGTQTKEASAEQYRALISSRNSKARAIQEWIGKDISWMNRNGALGDTFASGRTIVDACNSHYATFAMRGDGETLTLQSEPLSRLEISYDHQRHRLQIIRYGTR